MELLFGRMIERSVIADGIARFGGGHNWQTEVVIHSARGVNKDGRADAIDFNNGDIIEVKKDGVDRARQVKQADLQLNAYIGGWKVGDPTVVPRCVVEKCPTSIRRASDFANEGEANGTTVQLLPDMNVKYWREENGIVLWKYKGNWLDDLKRYAAAWLATRAGKTATADTEEQVGSRSNALEMPITSGQPSSTGPPPTIATGLEAGYVGVR